MRIVWPPVNKIPCSWFSLLDNDQVVNDACCCCDSNCYYWFAFPGCLTKCVLVSTSFGCREVSAADFASELVSEGVEEPTMGEAAALLVLSKNS